MMVLGTLAANEAARAIEEATDHRYELRHRFGEALLAQAAIALNGRRSQSRVPTTSMITWLAAGPQRSLILPAAIVQTTALAIV